MLLVKKMFEELKVLELNKIKMAIYRKGIIIVSISHEMIKILEITYF